MNFLSYIMPKLAWFIPLCVMAFVVYVIIQNRQSHKIDKFIIENGIEVTGNIKNIKFDENQNLKNKVIITLTLEFIANGKITQAERIITTPVYTVHNIKENQMIKLKYMEDDPHKIYLPDYHNM